MWYSDKEVEKIREKYPPGITIVINYMDDPRPIPPGTKGVVNFVDDAGTMHCTFENGRKTGVIPGEDDFTVISRPEQKKEKGLNR